MSSISQLTNGGKIATAACHREKAKSTQTTRDIKVRDTCRGRQESWKANTRVPPSFGFKKLIMNNDILPLRPGHNRFSSLE